MSTDSARRDDAVAGHVATYRVEPAGVKVAEGHLFRTRPHVVLGLFDRVVRAWGALRARGGDFDAAYAIFSLEGALPSQWRTELQADRLVGRDT